MKVALVSLFNKSLSMNSITGTCRLGTFPNFSGWEIYVVVTVRPKCCNIVSHVSCHCEEAIKSRALLNTAESGQRSRCNDQATDCTTEELQTVFIFRAELHSCIAPKSLCLSPLVSLFLLLPFSLSTQCFLCILSPSY